MQTQQGLSLLIWLVLVSDDRFVDRNDTGNVNCIPKLLYGILFRINGTTTVGGKQIGQEMP